MSNTTATFSYQGNPVTFDFNENSKMVNATEMAKPFGRQPQHFLRNRQTEAFMLALNHYANSHSGNDQVANLQPGDILYIKNGGENKGTWMHEKLALKFAAWLSPQFELWIFDRIQELLLTGFTQIRPNLLPAAMERHMERQEWRMDEMKFNLDMQQFKIARLKLEMKITALEIRTDMLSHLLGSQVGGGLCFTR